MEKSARPTKKQQELLTFIDGFIKGHGYGPSYREVMRALGYKSVSTVAAHIDALIVKGYLRKADYSARSIEVVSNDSEPSDDKRALKWLATKESELRAAGESQKADAVAAVIEILDQKGV